MTRLPAVAALAAAVALAPTGRTAPLPKRPPDVITNSIELKLRRVPAGDFLMGSPETDKDALPDEKPQHKVKLTKPFFVGVTAVTVGQFKAFAAASGYKTEAETGGGAWKTIDRAGRIVDGTRENNWRNTGLEQTDDFPVVNVNYPDAEAFCAWLSKKEGKTYRLPTEAEWEYACRAGTTTRWSCGDDKDEVPDFANIAVDHFPKHARGNGPKATGNRHLFMAPVGSLKSNPWGLYDVHGNVWQWCADRYDEAYYANSPAADPEGPGKGDLRVIRGGTWSRGPLDCRSANRFGLSSAISLWVGFRVVREADGTD